MSDGIAIGEQAYRKLTDAWLSAANDILSIDDKETLREFRVAFGRNPAHIRKAVERFPNIWNPELHPDLFQLLATIQLSKVKDDAKAIMLFEDWSADIESNYDDLKESIAELNGNGKPRAKHCKRCQRLDEIMHGRDFIHKAELYQLLNDKHKAEK